MISGDPMATARSAAMLALAMLLFAQLSAAGSINETAAYQTCMTTPSSCSSLSFYNRQLTGTLPTELGIFTNLMYMTLWMNAMTGSIPSELGALTRLRTMKSCTTLRTKSWINYKCVRMLGHHEHLSHTYTR
mmetsp:Transcript_9660/g.18196  ORF Transcript_9660/g.18196 Transcript_9660/m.18196 type:complete len:132 (-) Transcript_9660:164-559(-)